MKHLFSFLLIGLCFSYGYSQETAKKDDEIELDKKSYWLNFLTALVNALIPYTRVKNQETALPPKYMIASINMSVLIKWESKLLPLKI